MVLLALSEMASLILRPRFANFTPRTAIGILGPGSARRRVFRSPPETRPVKGPYRNSMARCFTWVSGDSLCSLEVNFQGQRPGQKSKKHFYTTLLALLYGARRDPTHMSWETQESHHRKIRVIASRNAPESDHQKAMFHWLLSQKNFSGSRRGRITPYLEAASGFEPEYGALQAPA